MSTVKKVAVTASVPLAVFAIFAMLMNELKYTEIRSGKLQHTDNVISHSINLQYIAARSWTYFEDSLLTELAQYAASVEQRHKYFVLGHDSVNALADTLPPPPVQAGAYDPDNNFLLVEYNFKLNGHRIERRDTL